MGRVEERGEWRGEQKAGSEEGAEGVGRGKQWRQAGVSPTGQGREERNQPERRARAASFPASLLPSLPPFSSPLITFTSLN